MNKRNIEAIYPLSPMQQGMLFHSIYNQEDGVYFEQLTCTLEGDLNVPAFQKAWQQVIDRNPILRTSFVWKRLDKTLQVVHKQVKLPFISLDWSDKSAADQKISLDNFLKENRKQGFKLSEPPLIRLAIIRLGENRYQFVWCHHHLLLDGWSLPLIIKEVFSFYEAYRLGQEIHLDRTRPFRDYITWLQSQNVQEAENFWRNKLTGFTAPIPLVIDQIVDCKNGQDESYPKHTIYLSEETTSLLNSSARKNQITLNTLVQGAWALLLSIYSGEEDVLFGAIVSGRPTELQGVESMMGIFINTIPIRIHVAPEASLISWLKQLHAQQTESQHYSYSSLIDIQGWSDIPRDLPLFESIIVFENYPVDDSLKEYNGSLKIKNVHSSERTNYPITLVSTPGKKVPLCIAYDCERIDATFAIRTLHHLKNILVNFAANPEEKIKNINILSPEEQNQILVDWNTTERNFIKDKCIHQLFETQVEKTPDTPAVIFESEELTYRKLNQRSNQLAHYLRKLGVREEVLVGICMERSVEMIVAMLGVLKAGGAYVPIDPNYPHDRISYMFDDSGVSVLLTQTHLSNQLPKTNAEIFCLDASSQLIDQENDQNLVCNFTSQNLSYVIYTSGSTGRPKGTLLNHKGLSNFCKVFSQTMKIGEGTRFLQFASISFDASVAEIFPALISGATLYLAKQEVLLSAIELNRFMRDHEITTIVLPPSMWKILPTDGLEKLQNVMTAGESCTKDIIDRWADGRRFYNGYGPTEATIGATWQQINKLYDDATHVPIGHAFDNKKVYVLDKYMRPVPVGISGELYIGGVGLSRGYRNRPDLTAEKFVPNPFNGVCGERIYKTGDLVRYRLDGNLEFLGRIDHQVKIRGFRIELGEIEALLHQHSAIATAAVIAREDQPGDTRLVAYYVPDNEITTEPTTTDLYEYLRGQLPEYMVPAIFMKLDEMPLTPNGKIDRKALPAPEQGRPELGKAYVAPRTPTEDLLTGIMAQVLGLEHVGIYDSFFELGGHSLMGVRVQSRIRDTFQIELPLRRIFEAPTVAELATIVEQEKLAYIGLEAPPIEKISRDQELPLSFAQQRLWFLDQLEPNSPFYNIPAALKITGALNIDALEQSINEIIRRHETLRTSFQSVKGKPFQMIETEVIFSLKAEDLSHLSQDEHDVKVQQLAAAEAQSPFNLSKSPLFRVKLYRLANEEHVILFTMHHIISDGWSMGVLIREIVILYEAYSKGKTSTLPDLTLQYADFAHWQKQWLQGEVLEHQLSYWKEQLQGVSPMLELPTDRPRPAVQSFHGATLSTVYSADLLKSLRAFSQKEGVTLFMTVFAAFKTLLYRYTGQGDINIGTPHANRNRSETENLIGFFVNTLVLRTNLSDNPNFKELVRRVREVAYGAYAHQDVPFETLVEAIQPERNLSHTPLFQVMFVFQNAPNEELRISDLTFSPIKAESGTAKFDLSLIIAEVENGLSVSFEYNTDLFNEATIQRMMNHFEIVLHNVLTKPEQPVSLISVMSDQEQEYIVKDWNLTTTEFPRDLCMHQWFERLADDKPDAIAVTFKDQYLTYQELNFKANQLANYLRKNGLRSEELIGICMERSFEMVISILATLKAGGAFIPLDPVYPEERLAYMISDSNISVLLTQQFLAEKLSAHKTAVVYVDIEWQKIAKESNGNLDLPITPQNLAYVIYTSGSTGKPKGTMLQHQGWCNLGSAQQHAFGVGKGSRILQFSSLSFDASVWEIVMALLSGATLTLTDREMLTTGQGLLEVLEKEKITTVTLPPSVLAVVPVTKLPNLSTIITAGEACSADLIKRWAKGRRFFNAYGPTETSVCASMFLVPEDYSQNPPIGTPISNFQLYVLDKQLQLVPIGVPGELCIGGLGVARGYLKRPDLTAKKFVPDPFSGEIGARLYKSGDLVRYLPDGNIEFLGRIDHQVKVRGFRIELGEIEAILNDHPQIRDVVVIVRKDQGDDRRLVAYLIAEPGCELTVGRLRSYLRERLPDYMLPSAFMTLDEFPLTPNGKVDRQALPAPDQSRPELENIFVEPRNDTEKILTVMCAELLNIERVGVYDNFFELGGHSLLATQLIARIRDDFLVELPLRTLFESPTIAELADRIMNSPTLSNEEQVEKIEAVDRGDKDIDQLLSELDQLSEDEAEILLKSEMK